MKWEEGLGGEDKGNETREVEEVRSLCFANL